MLAGFNMILGKKITEITEKAVKEIVTLAAPDAVIQFGSSVNGDSWQESDVDLFVISRKAKAQTGFFMEREGIVFHGNVISPKAMREKLKNPAKLTFHSLFAGCKVIYDRTDWIRSEKLRLVKYPIENRLYQIMEKLEAALYQIYNLRKAYALYGESVPTIDLPGSTMVKIFEIKRVDQGQYFGKTLVGKLSKSETKKIKRIQQLKLKFQIRMLEKDISPWLAKYLPLWANKLSTQKRALSFEELNRRLIIDAFHIYTEARARGLLSFEEAPRSVHGFKVNEWVVKAI